MRNGFEALRINRWARWLTAAAFIAAATGPLSCAPKKGTAAAATIKVSGAYALYPMMAVWAEQYKILHPEVKIEVSGGGAGKGMADVLGGLVDIGMVSRDVRPEEVAKGAYAVPVVKDAVVVTLNARNPVYGKLAAKGVSREQFEKVFITREITTWGELAGDPTNKDPIKVYTRADACGAAETWAKYLGTYVQEDLTKAADAGIMNDPDLAAAVIKDRFAVGYNNINFAYDVKTSAPLDGIRVCPVDVNGDGTLGADENFYATQKDLLAAIAAGKYPSPPARDLNVVAKSRFTGATLAFVKWTLTDGQRYVAESGYIPLPAGKLKAELAKLETEK